MNICVLGAGYVGIASAVCLAETGNNVTCADKQQAKIDSLSHGVLPVYEDGMQDICRRNMQEGRLRFTADIRGAIAAGEVVLIAVGTPSAGNGDVDMSQVQSALDDIIAALERSEAGKVVITKSTVPVGTQALMQQRLDAEGRHKSYVVSCPEFLQEGTALQNMMHPDRVVIGSDSDYAAGVVSQLMAPFGGEQVITDPKSAELIKYASNTFLATKISFINEIANLCDRVGADVGQVARGMGLDPRIGRQFLRAGIGFGGACFPKDVKGLISIARQNGYDMRIIQSVMEVNTAQQLRCMDMLADIYPDLEGLTIAVLGLTFKPETDDVRLAPAIANIERLLQLGAKVRAYDPVGMGNFRAILPSALPADEIVYCDSPEQAVQGADGLLLLTEWERIRNMDLEAVLNGMRRPVFLDGRNVFDPKAMLQAGFIYRSIGRPTE